MTESRVPDAQAHLDGQVAWRKIANGEMITGSEAIQLLDRIGRGEQCPPGVDPDTFSPERVAAGINAALILRKFVVEPREPENDPRQLRLFAQATA